MATKTSQEICGDCVKRGNCDCIPSGGKLLRCLDKKTEASPEAKGDFSPDNAADGTSAVAING